MAPFQEIYSESLSVQLRPEECLKKLAEGSHIVPG